MIPRIDVSALFGAANDQRDKADRAILASAGETGFITITATPELLPVDFATRAEICGYSHWIVCNAPLCCVKRSPPEILGAAHVDSGFVTLLAQDGVAGLQAEDSCGRWTDVPAEEGSLAVNFGGLLERWTGGRVRATRHRVIGYGTPRYSIPFFYEPAADALIETLPLPDTPCIAPFRYGDHLWSAMMRFPEFRGLEGARIPRGV